MSPLTIAVRAAALLATLLVMTACNGGSGGGDPEIEPLAAPTAQETLESLDDLPGGIGPSDETPDGPPNPE